MIRYDDCGFDRRRSVRAVAGTRAVGFQKTVIVIEPSVGCCDVCQSSVMI